ncbi:MAG: hypothetical protein ABI308_14590 [Mucilaginibacter sp.]
MKKNQKIKPQKSFPARGKTPRPAFCGGPLPAFVRVGVNVYVHINNSKISSAEKLRVKSGSTCWTVWWKGHCKFLLKRGAAGTKWGKNIAAREC